MDLRRIDHVVLTVADMDATIAFYVRVLGMRHVVTGDRHALHFGDCKLNLHPEVNDLPPLKAAVPTLGSEDICLVARGGDRGRRGGAACRGRRDRGGAGRARRRAGLHDERVLPRPGRQPRRDQRVRVITGRNAVLVAGAAIVVVLLASVAIAQRDSWFRALKRHRRLVELVVLGAVIAVVAALLVAHHDELEGLLERIENGDPLWLAIAAACEIASFAGYVVLVRIIHSPLAPRLDVPASIELTLAGVVATRLLSAGGAGGIAFTAWVLHRAGMPNRVAARRLFAFLVVLYTTYMGSLIVGGIVVIAGVGDVPRALGITALAVGSLRDRRGRAHVRRPPRRPDPARRTRGDRGGARDRPRPARVAARVARVVGRGHRDALGVLPRVRRPARGRDRDPLLLPRAARQPAPAARRRGRDRGRDDRRVRGLRRQPRADARLRRDLPGHLVLPAGDPGPARLRRRCGGACAAGASRRPNPSPPRPRPRTPGARATPRTAAPGRCGSCPATARRTAGRPPGARG